MPCNQLFVNKRTAGFTLIEMVVGIVVLSIGLTMLTSLLYPQVQKSVDPIYQLRAAELANTLISEIQGKKFDEKSNPSQGIQCDDGVAGHECSTELGPDTETRDFYDDVDDYHDFNLEGQLLGSASQYQNLYANFSLTVTVIYDGDYNGSADTNHKAKLITVIVTTPAQEALEFAVYRGNY